MRTTVTMTVLAAMLLPAVASGQAQPQAQPQRALLDRYCVTCHSERNKANAAGLALDAIDVSQVGSHPAVWEKVVRKLRAGAMPPVGRPRPDEATYNGFAGWLETELDRAARQHPNPGRSEALHRLSRTEYQNVVRDVLGVEADVAALLPSDDQSYGFDNIAGILGISPTLLERYLVAARRIARLALASPSITPTAETFVVRGDLNQGEHLEGLPFGTRGGVKVRFNFPRTGEYVFKVDIAGRITEPQELEIAVDGERLTLLKVTRGEAMFQDTGGGPPVLQARGAIKAGPREVTAAFVKASSAEADGLRQPFLRPFTFGGAGGSAVSELTITGPLEAMPDATAEDTLSRRRIFVCQPSKALSEDRCARRILSTLARRAYRRPVTDEDLQGLVEAYAEGRKAPDDGSFEFGIEMALRRLLVSPDFLFRAESEPAQPPANGAYRVSDLELASRISFFIWSSVPDDELLAVAEKGELRKPDVLERQVRRMLADSRARALVDNFAAQWLLLRRIEGLRPDAYAFPDFDDSLRTAFRRETELFVESVLLEDRSILDLLTANYTFLNSRLAKHYGVPNIGGSHFRKVTFPAESPRGGLLGQGSILTLTSYPTRTSPVVRGKWILENILGTPPPPPPPNIPALVDKAPDGRVLSMRERMAQHRANPVCATCHSLMDPLGLSLENFDGVGQWRLRSESFGPIDASGALPGGLVKFDGARGLRQALLARSEQFVTTLTEKLFVYALGRGLEPYDAPAIRTVVRAAAARDHHFSSIVLGIVNSTPFQMRRARS